MQKPLDSSGNFDMNRAKSIAGSPAGQQLLAMLQAKNSDALKKAMSAASSGDYLAAQQSLTTLLKDPEVQALLKRLEG